MQFIGIPRVVAILIAFVIIFVAVADANAYLYFVIPVLALDVGLTLANANALSNNDPNIITGVAGMAMGSMITYYGVLFSMEIEETWHVGFTALLGAIGISSVVYGWKVIKASSCQEDTARHQRDARFVPLCAALPALPNMSLFLREYSPLSKNNRGSHEPFPYHFSTTTLTVRVWPAVSSFIKYTPDAPVA